MGHGRQVNEASEDEGCVRYGTEISENPGLSLRPLVEMVSYHQANHLSSFVPGRVKKTKELRTPGLSPENRIKITS